MILILRMCLIDFRMITLDSRYLIVMMMMMGATFR